MGGHTLKRTVVDGFKKKYTKLNWEVRVNLRAVWEGHEYDKNSLHKILKKKIKNEKTIILIF